MLEGKRIARKDKTSIDLLSHQHTPQSSLNNKSVHLVEMKRASAARSSIADSEMEFEVDRLAPKITPIRNKLVKAVVKN